MNHYEERLERDLGAIRAEVIARKAYPGSGIYSSSGRRPADQLDTGMVDFMDGHGYDFGHVRPQPLDLSVEELAGLHVIVSLEGPVPDYIEDLPFHTVDLEWPLPNPTRGEEWEGLYQHLLLNIRQLMEALRGKEAP